MMNLQETKDWLFTHLTEGIDPYTIGDSYRIITQNERLFNSTLDKLEEESVDIDETSLEFVDMDIERVSEYFNKLEKLSEIGANLTTEYADLLNTAKFNKLNGKSDLKSEVKDKILEIYTHLDKVRSIKL